MAQLSAYGRRMSILRHPDFRRLWIADLLSQLGSRLSIAGLQ